MLRIDLKTYRDSCLNLQDLDPDRERVVKRLCWYRSTIMLAGGDKKGAAKTRFYAGSLMAEADSLSG